MRIVDINDFKDLSRSGFKPMLIASADNKIALAIVSTKLPLRERLEARIFAIDDVFYFGMLQRLIGRSKEDWKDSEYEEELFTEYETLI